MPLVDAFAIVHDFWLGEPVQRTLIVKISKLRWSLGSMRNSTVSDDAIVEMPHLPKCPFCQKRPAQCGAAAVSEPDDSHADAEFEAELSAYLDAANAYGYDEEEHDTLDGVAGGEREKS